MDCQLFTNQINELLEFNIDVDEIVEDSKRFIYEQNGKYVAYVKKEELWEVSLCGGFTSTGKRLKWAIENFYNDLELQMEYDL